MLKAIQILGSSSCSSACFSLPHRFNKSFDFKKTHFTSGSDSPKSHFLAFKFRKGCIFRAFQMPHNQSESTPDGGSSPPSSSKSTAINSAGFTKKINFCQVCGGTNKHEVPEGEEKLRAICTRLWVASLSMKTRYYCVNGIFNRLMAYGHFLLVIWRSGSLLLREQLGGRGRRRTQKSKSCHHLLNWTSPLLAKRPYFSPGPESSECKLFAVEEIPFDSLAFSSMLVTLKLYLEDKETGRPKFHYGIINKRPGTSPSEIHAYTLDNHLRC